jgi:multidrug resistance efflux pump
MIKFKTCKKATIIIALLPLSAVGQTENLLFTGEVYSQQAQEIFVPLTTNWQARISRMLPEGSEVKIGDVAVEFDGSEAARQLEQQQESQRTELAKTERDLAKLEKELVEAEYKLKQAQVSLDLATLKADLPDGLIGGLEFAENKLDKEKAIKVVEDAIVQLADKKQGLAERQKQAELDAGKAANQYELWNQMLTTFTVRANQPGFIIYGKHPWTRAKFQEGDTVQTSFRVAQIADTAALAIHVWINSIDRPRVKVGAAVSISLDALPDERLSGRLELISDSGAKRPEWGTAVYYEGVVVFDAKQHSDLLPGMSALVEPVL